MALKDCIKKFQKAGVPISSADIEKLEAFIEQGMTDEQAVRALTVELDKKIVDIASYAASKGAQVQERKDVLGEVRSFAQAEEKKLRTRLAEIQKLTDAGGALAQVSDDINFIESIFRHWEPGGPDIDVYDDTALMTRINEMFFHPATGDLLRNGKLVMGMLKGKTQLQIFNNFRDLQDKREEIRTELLDLLVEGQEITNRLLDMKLRDNGVREMTEPYPSLNEPKTKGPKQGDLFSSPDVPVDKRIIEAKANYDAIVKVEVEKEISVGITRVNGPADAAHVLAEIRRNASEGMWAVVLDKDNNVVGIVEHARGTFDGTAVYPSTYAGAVITIPGAAKVWLMHNHPSGVLEPSQADERITRRIDQLMEGSGVKVQGHVLVGGGNSQFTEFGEHGVLSRGPITPAARNKKVPVYTRKIRGKQNGRKISSPADTQQVLKDMGNPEGVLMLNNRHHVLGFLSMTPQEMSKLKHTGQSNRLIRALADMNAAAFIVSTKEKNTTAANNMASFGNLADWRMLDALYLENGQTKSMASEGTLSATQTFYQSSIGFTSGLLTAARTMPNGKGKANEMLALLKKQPGVTKAEMEWLGVDEWLEAEAELNNTVTRDQIIKFVENNGIEVVETQALGDAAYKGQSMPNGNKPRDIFLKLPEIAEDTLVFTLDLEHIGEGYPIDDDQADDLFTFIESEPRMAGAVLERENSGQPDLKLTVSNVTEQQYDLLVEEMNALSLNIAKETTTDFRIEAPPAGEKGLQENFGFSHFNEKNILAWMRTTERYGPSGERILFVEEVQSDWHQRGSRYGYRGDEEGLSPEAIKVLDDGIKAAEHERVLATIALDEVLDSSDLLGFDTKGEARRAVRFNRDWAERWDVTDPVAIEAGDRYAMAVESHRQAKALKREALRKVVDAVPNAPFKGRGWPSLAMKRIIRLAAEEGYDQVAWTPGHVQNKRAGREADDSAHVNFYDNELVNLTNKAARKLDKNANVVRNGQRVQTSTGAPFRVELRRNPRLYGQARETLGWYVMDATNRIASGPYELEEVARGIANKKNHQQIRVHSLDITEQMKEAALEGQTLFQKKKGSITFDEVGRATIRLFQSRDLSTFLHESGHLYLEVIGSLAERPEATDKIKADYAKILEYLGVENRGQITREHHELWAESFEKYLYEGKAPSMALQDAFNSFRRWLTDIWRRMRQSPDAIQLTDEIRGVMDRMLATDDEIKAARAVEQLQQTWLTAEAMGVSQEVFEVYRTSIVNANNEELERLTVKAMAALKRDQLTWWKDEKKKVQAEVEAEAHAARVYKALAFLQRGTRPDGSALTRAPFKLDKADLIDRYGKEFVGRLPKPWVYSVEGGVDTDVAATALGYKSANEMIEDLIKVPSMNNWIKAETEARMQQLFPDPLIDGSIAEDAVRIVHNDRRASVLAAEMRQLRELQRRDRAIVSATKKDIQKNRTASRDANKASLPKREELAIIKQAARATIGAKQVKDINPRIYLNAERKAGRRAFELAGQNNFEEAYVEKRKQIVNYEMYRAAVRAKEQSEKIRNYMTKFSKPRVQQRLGKLGVLDRILAVIENVDFANKTLKEVELDAALRDLREAVESGRMVVMPETAEKIFSGNVNWKELTADDLVGLRDIVKQLEKEADLQLKMPVNGEMIVLEEAKEEIISQILDNNQNVTLQKGTKTPKQQRSRELNSAISHWLGPSVLARLVDGEGWGAINRLMINNIRRAYTERLLPMQQKALEDVTKIWTKRYTNAERRRMDRKDFAVVGREQMSRNDVISLALNMGNDGNLTALLNGVDENGQLAYPEADVRAAVAKLESKDWMFVQDIWDYIGSYWPQLSQAMKERRGVSAEKVEPTSFTMVGSDGVEVNLSGGYYPLAYNPEFSDRVKAQIFDDHYTNMGNGVFVSATTRAGATYNRVKNHKNVVALGVFQIDKHLKEITRDIAIGNEVNFVKNLINDKDVRAAFRKTGNLQALNTLNLWLTDAAVGELPANSVVERRIAYIRVGFTKSKLAYNIYTTALQLTGAFQSMAVIGSKSMAMGLGRVMANPVKAWKEAFEMSAFLKVRYGQANAFDKDVQDTSNFLQQNFGGGIPTTAKMAMDKISRTFFWPIAKMQSLVDVTTWYGGYWKGRNEEGLSDADAIFYADAQVELAQTSGFFSDRSNIERGTLSTSTRQQQFIRLWTTLISYMLRKGNIAYMKTQEFKKDIGFISAAQYASDLILLFTLEGLTSALIYGNWPDDAEEPEDYLKFTAEQTALSVLSGVPFAREITTAVYGGGNTPVGGLASDLSDLYIQALQGENDKAAREAFVKSFGTLFHVPASQTNRMLEALIDEDDPELLEYFTGTRD